MDTRILLVDDHQIFRETLRNLLESKNNLQVVGETGNGNDVAFMVDKCNPSIVCMDIGIPGINGIEITRRITASNPQVKVIALSTHIDHFYVEGMMNAGASAFVAKIESSRELFRAIEAVQHGHKYLCPSIADIVTNALINNNENRCSSALSNRERQVLCLIANGFISQQIATHLGISTGTVDVHRRNIMRKLDIHSAVELTRFAISNGIVCQ